MLLALLIAQAVPLSLVSPAELAQAKHAIPVLLGRLHRGETTAAASPGAAPLERFLSAYGDADSDAAWKLFKRLQQDEPELPWGETGMGRIYVEWRLWDQAEGAFARALKLSPGFPLALVERALLWRASGQPDRAREDARAALLQDPNDARATLVLAELDQDEHLYAQALQLAPELYEAGAALAAIAEHRGDLPAALAALEKLAQAAPRDGKVQQQIALLRVRTGDLAGAAQALETAVGLGVASKETLAELARLEQKLGHREEEERALLRLRRLAPRERGPLVRLAQLHAADPSADARALLALDPHDALGHLLLAQGSMTDDARLAELDAAAQGRGDKTAREQARLKAEALRDELGVPQAPLTATTVNGLYYRASNVITHAYEKRRAAAPDLRGKLELKVRVNASGNADSVELVQDELRDQPLSACVSATLKEAHYPVKQTTLDFKFDLRPPK
jgi:tetratricopeptide (TPR) repeat protein